MKRPAPQAISWLWSAIRDDAASTAAEFALVLPIFLLTIFSSLYLCMMLGALINLHAVTEQAARCLAVNAAGACTTANVDTYAKARFTGPGITGLAFTASAPACGKQVSASGTFSMFTGLKAVSVTLSTSACYPVI
ncbi:TadE/TadG family type IV pilus assembly protein [Sphingomonas oryzagri]|uniref:Pilus assembly protein n=1 Tax=Sphingomonas oryzagri TaxID=3042314 RepID=A0ABT6MWZ4_9SPHN|nr:TadE family protein [Sphingomonas oryzagri]MDH7637318.1 pilus assembly protein [Sphingomonas oryzagri]